MSTPIHVLFVADDYSFVSECITHLEPEGYTVEWLRVSEPDQAQAALDRGNWNTVIVDGDAIGIPVRDALNLVIAAGTGLPLIVITASDDDEWVLSLLRAGAGEVLGKGHLVKLGFIVARELDVVFRSRDWYHTLDELQAAVEAATVERLKAETIIAVIDAAISIQGTDYRIIYQNDAHRALAGDHLGEYCYAAMEGRSTPCSTCPMAQMLDDGKSHRGERVVAGAEGERIFEVTLSPFRDDSGVIIAGIELAQEITDRRRIEHSLWESERRFRETLEHSRLLAVCLDLEGTITFCNDFLLELTGWQRHELVGRNWFASFIPAGDCFGEIFRETLPKGEFPRHFENAILTRNGESRLISWNSTLLRNYQGEVNGISCIGEDVTSRRRAEDKVREQLRFIQILIDTIPNPIFYKDRDGIFLGCNRAFEQHVGLAREQIVGKTIFDLVPTDLANVFHKGDLALLAGKEIHIFESSVICADGTSHEMIFYEASFAFEDEAVGGIVGTLLDISERKKAEARLRFLGTHDILTGLHNRAYFDEELERFKHGRKFPISIIMADVDRLKFINDTLGHARGDELLKRTAAVLRRVFRVEDVVARVGGDEFSALLPLTDTRAARKTLKRIRTALAEHNAEHPCSPLSLSLGVATAEIPEQLMDVWQKADRNMYEDKLSRRGSPGTGSEPLPRE
jgi:diguanylate cyclase (GGDEF)-like protein/PAS domain S-box-containing protein